MEMFKEKVIKKLDKFSRILRDVSGIWTDEESSEFVKRLRKELEERLKKMGAMKIVVGRSNII